MDKKVYRPVWVYISREFGRITRLPSVYAYSSLETAIQEGRERWEHIKGDDKIVHMEIEEITIL